jgi:ActR/RegA family two-component response regulator
MFAQLRKVLFILILLGLSGVAYAYRANIKTFADAYITKPHEASEIAEANAQSFVTTTNDVSITNADGSITITHTITKVAVADTDSNTNSDSSKPKTAKGAAASAIKTAQANAKIRDEIIDSLAK